MCCLDDNGYESKSAQAYVFVACERYCCAADEVDEDYGTTLSFI